MDFYQYFGGWHEAQAGGRDFHGVVNEIDGEDYRRKYEEALERMVSRKQSSVLRNRDLVNSSASPAPVDSGDCSCWISPQGDIHYLNGSVHYMFLLNNLELFGLSEGFVREAENKFTNKNTLEINTVGLCDYMHDQAFVRGWIRVRDQRKMRNFSVEFHNPRIAENVLFGWAADMVEKGRGNCDVLLYCWELKERFRYTVQHMATSQEALFQSKRFLDWGELFSRKRRKSKYNGSLVNNTFADATPSAPVTMSIKKDIKSHPSIRYMVLSGMLNRPEDQDQVKIMFSGKLDTLLYQVYASGLGRKPGHAVTECGDNGRVVLIFDTKSGQPTEADLGGKLETGYVVESLYDPLGIFPEGTECGDFLDLGLVKQIVLAQGQRDRNN